MAEWSMAAVLKTVSPKGDVGSNPTPSAMHHVGCMAGHALYVVHGCPEPHMVSGLALNITRFGACPEPYMVQGAI
jgi:hypothetical protein